MEKTWLITGASRGLGLQLAKAALAAGDMVVGTSRRTAGLADALAGREDRLLVVDLDVTDRAAAARAVDAAIARFGRIDILVNNAGQAQLGWFETISDEHVRRQFEINLFGAMNVTRAVLPRMRARRAGLVVTISSVNGLVSNPGGSVYSASKFALEGWIEGLAQEVAPLGIRTLTVEPGMMRTDFLDAGSARHGDIEIADYAEAVAQFQAFIRDANGRQPGDPAILAARIVEMAAMPSVPPRFVFGTDAIAWTRDKLEQLRAQLDRSAGMAAQKAV